MMTDELSICGYCCTGRLVNARQPTRTRTRLTTTARTGCRMKMSVIDFMRSLRSFRAGRLLGRVGDRDQRGFAQLEGARGGDLLAGLDPAVDQDFLAQHRTALHGAHVRPRLAGRVGLDHEDVVALRPLAERADRHA